MSCYVDAEIAVLLVYKNPQDTCFVKRITPYVINRFGYILVE